MTSPKTLSRRQLLAAGAAIPLAAGTAPAFAAAEMKGIGGPRFHRMKLGAFEVTTLLAGTRVFDSPKGIFGLNATDAEFEAVTKAANLPIDKALFTFTPTVVNTGKELILFDTGLNPDGVVDALGTAGYSADQIDAVVITHTHGDHVGGLAIDGEPTFKNARHIIGAREFATSGGGLPFSDRFDTIQSEESIASGVTALEAYGHTPGHMAYRLESMGKQLILGADFANHYIWSLAHPEWEVAFDGDKAAAAATRKRLLDMMAADNIPFIGYHMPWPGVGYVETRGDGYHYVPASYQLML